MRELGSGRAAYGLCRRQAFRFPLLYQARQHALEKPVQIVHLLQAGAAFRRLILEKR